MYYTIKQFLITLSLLLTILLCSGCIMLRRATIFDVALINTSPSSVLIINNPTYFKKNTLNVTYTYLQPNQEGLLNLNSPEVEKSVLQYHILENIFVFNNTQCVQNFSIEYIYNSRISRKILNQILTTCQPEKKFSREELTEIVLNNPNQYFFLQCVLNESLEVYCEPTTDLIEQMSIRF